MVWSDISAPLRRASLPDDGWRIMGEMLARVYLTGGLRFDGPSGSFGDTELPGPQGRLAFAVLVVERRAVTREHLASLVWDDAPPEAWSAALTSILSKVRHLVTRAGLDGRRVVVSSGGSCGIRLPAGCWVDLEDAERRTDRAQGALRHGDSATAAREATVASAVLRRPFLPGLRADWADARRARLEEVLLRCLVTLAGARSELGDHDLAAVVAAEAIRRDPLRETAHRALVRAELGRGDRGAAARAYQDLVRTLEVELGVPPSPQTAALLDGLG
jgi:DNA-binding SARP family transcriptional activator